jgi:hypothetical protein
LRRQARPQWLAPDQPAHEAASVLDFTSLIVIAGLFMGLVVGDATIFGDRVQVQITVAPKVAATGFTGPVAEQVFAAHVSDMDQGNSIIDTPTIQVNSQPPVLAALARPLSLENAVIALQTQAGFDVVIVRGVILEDTPGNQLTMLTVVNMPDSQASQFRLTQENGDATTLVQRAAEAAMDWVSPYRLALTLFGRGLHGDAADLARAKAIATRAIARPRTPSRTTERAMLHNLLAMAAMLDDDRATVEAQFARAETVPATVPNARGIIQFNQAFWDLVISQPQAAQQHYELGKALAVNLHSQGQGARTQTLGGLIAWSLGDLARAEGMLREAIADGPVDDVPYTYLGQLLEAKGDATAAAAARAAANTRRSDGTFPAQAVSTYWVDPVHGGMHLWGEAQPTKAAATTAAH